MNRIQPAVVLSLALFASLGCQKVQPPADSLPTEPGVAAAPQAVPADVVFTVEPGQVHMCDGRDRVASDVSWQVNVPDVTTVRIEVDTAADAVRKTFAAGGAGGSEKTGDWVVQGVRFHLVDAATGKELASHEVKGLPCN